MSNSTAAMWFFVGFCYWTLMEYVLHRFLFHGEDTWMKYIPFNKYVYTFHFLMHGIHHAFPQDEMRLAYPPVPGHMIFYPLMYTPIVNFLPDGIDQWVFLGCLFGYQCYDQIHYWTHHSSMNFCKYFRD